MLIKTNTILLFQSLVTLLVLLFYLLDCEEKCLFPLILCSTGETLGTSIELIGHGYVEFSKDLLSHQRRSSAEVISLNISTTESNGLIFWQGQRPGEQGGKDYLALALNEGYVEFR